MMFMKQNCLLKDSVGIHIRATDNSKIEKFFKDEFKELLVTFPEFIPKVSNGGIHHWAKDNADSELIEEMVKESIIDMFVLSKTSYLFYKKGSTFRKISKTYQLAQENCFNWLTYSGGHKFE